MNIEQIITITLAAQEQIKKLLTQEEDDKVLRLAVKGGGCSGLSYALEFTKIKDNDNIMQFDDFKVIMDPKSSLYLKDIILDFQGGLNGKGFIFNNPNASNTCGCGESFTL